MPLLRPATENSEVQMLALPYANRPGRLLAQVIADLLVIAWIWGCWKVATFTWRTVSSLATPGRQLQEGGQGVATSLREAGEKTSGVPFVGDKLQRPFTSAGEAADRIAAAGQQQVEVVSDLAWMLSALVFAFPVLLVVAVWLPLRVRYARKVAGARAVLATQDATGLLALRALATQSTTRIAKISANPLADWRAGDPRVCRELAALELRSLGLETPLQNETSTLPVHPRAGR